MNIILVTGGSGYIGSHTAHYLTQHNKPVIILDTQEPAFEHPWATYICGDYGDTKLLDQIFTQYKISAVVHCAAYAQVAESFSKPLEYYSNNVTKTINLIDSMHKHAINTLIFSSSCAVFGIPHGPLTEEHSRNPISPYGRTKLYIEQILADFVYAHPKFCFIALRYFNAAGAFPEYNLGERHNPETHCIPIVLNSAITRKPFTIFGTDYPTTDGTCIRDYVHVLDIADAHYKALHYLETTRESHFINLGTGKGYSVQEVITTAQRITDTTITIRYGTRREGDPACLVAQNSKARKILNWQPHNSSLESMVSSAYAFMLKEIQELKKHNTILSTAQT